MIPISTDSPLARRDTLRRLIKPQDFSIINEICAIVVEERERMEHALIFSAGLDSGALQGMALAVRELLQVESRIARLLEDFNKNKGMED